MEHEVVPEPGREVQLREVISHLLMVLDPLAVWYLLGLSAPLSPAFAQEANAEDLISRQKLL